MFEPSSADNPAVVRGQALGRRQIVWLALVVAMTAVGGLLLATDNGRRVATPLPAASAAQQRGVEAVFDVIEEGREYDFSGIVIHHSGDRRGSASTISSEHEALGLQGLGYHFVIGNGGGAGDGEIQVGYRWVEQLPGAHVSGTDSERYNRVTIGICLVGDGERHAFTEAQLRSLTALLDILHERLEIRREAVVLHRAIAPTTSPGRLFPESALYERLATWSR
ncbi:MAG: peptidoglycan recognition protein family protein [Phycisphaerales bacterium]